MVYKEGMKLKFIGIEYDNVEWFHDPLPMSDWDKLGLDKIYTINNIDTDENEKYPLTLLLDVDGDSISFNAYEMNQLFKPVNRPIKCRCGSFKRKDNAHLSHCIEYKHGDKKRRAKNVSDEKLHTTSNECPF